MVILRLTCALVCFVNYRINMYDSRSHHLTDCVLSIRRLHFVLTLEMNITYLYIKHSEIKGRPTHSMMQVIQIMQQDTYIIMPKCRLY